MNAIYKRITCRNNIKYYVPKKWTQKQLFLDSKNRSGYSSWFDIILCIEKELIPTPSTLYPKDPSYKPEILHIIINGVIVEICTIIRHGRMWYGLISKQLYQLLSDS